MNEWDEKIAKAKSENAEALSLQCKGIKDISALASLSGLKKLELSDCSSVEDISPLALLANLEELKMNSYSISGFSPLSSLSSLKKLQLSVNVELENLDFLSSLTGLKELEMFAYTKIEDFRHFSALKNLTSLNITITGIGRRTPESVQFLLGQKLRYFEDFKVIDSSPFSALKDLTSLRLNLVFDETDLDFLPAFSNLKSLKKLKLSSSWYGFDDISPLSSLESLEELDLRGSRRTKDISPLSSLVNLTKLNLFFCHAIEDFSPLGALVNLRDLNLKDTGIKDISFLTSLRNLEYLNLSECDGIKDFSPLGYLHKLDMSNYRNLNLPGVSRVEDVMPESSIIEINRDEQGRLHNEKGPSIFYKEGLKLYHWHGVGIPKAWIEEGMPSVQEALVWEDIEQRRVACEMIGWANIIKELDTKVIDENPDPEIGTLLEIQLPDSEVKNRFLKVRCGTGREFVIPVPPDMKTARQANAWTWGLKAYEYRPEVRT